MKPISINLNTDKLCKGLDDKKKSHMMKLVYIIMADVIGSNGKERDILMQKYNDIFNITKEEEVKRLNITANKILEDGLTL